MFLLYKNSFRIASNKELNEFISYMIELGANYINFLINRNKIYLPVHIEPKDAAVDVLAELFIQENHILIKFNDFFRNNLNDKKFNSEEELEPYMRGFIYTVIQNNILALYKDNDRFTYNLFRNVRKTLKNLDYCVTMHFSDKYVSRSEYVNKSDKIAEKEDLMKLVSTKGISKYVFEIGKFLVKFFDILDGEKEFSNIVRLSDLISVMKSFITMEYINRNGEETESEHISDRINIKYILEDARLSFGVKLNKYINKNNLSQKFKDCMYIIIDEIITDYNLGNQRRSVMELMKEHYQNNDKYLFYKIQYCIEMFEQEIAQFIEEDR